MPVLEPDRGGHLRRGVPSQGQKDEPGVNFINILREAYVCADPKSAKRRDSLTVFFALLGSFCVKAAHKMFVKSTPDRGSEAIEDGAREGRVSDHFVTRDQYLAHLSARKCCHRS